MNLTGTNQTFELTTNDVGPVNWTASWVDVDKTGATAYTPGSAHGSIASATTTTLVAAPASATVYRTITSITARNSSGAGVNTSLTFKKDVGGTEYSVFRAQLSANQSAVYEDGAGWDVYNSNGEKRGVGAAGADGVDGAPGAPGVGTTGTATLDFGGFPGASDASVTVTGQAGIVAGSVVEAWIRLAATGDHSADEHWVETLEVYAGNIVAATGFTIYGRNTNQINEQAGPAPLPKMPAGAAPGLNAVRPNYGGNGTRIFGQWTVQWRWS